MVKVIKTIINKIFLLLVKIKMYLYIFYQDFRNKNYREFGFFATLYYNFRGFYVDRKELYIEDLSEYLTDYERWKIRLVDREYNILLDDKTVNYVFFKEFVPFPQTNYLDLSNKESTLNALKEIENNCQIVFKPNDGAGGTGIFRVIKEDDGRFNLIDLKRKYNKEELLSFLKPISSEFLIQELIIQHDYSRSIFPQSTNSLRIVTIINDDKQAEVVSSIHRFGRNSSFPVDNWSKGGISTQVINGVLGKSIYLEGNKRFESDCHPDTGEKILGVRIPHWEKTIRSLKETHSKFSFIGLIAWDVVITEDGYKIIEMNASTGLSILQCHGGLRGNKLYERLLDEV